MDHAVHTSHITLMVEARMDIAERERLLDEAFGASRFEKTCERLRTGRLPAKGLAFVASNRDKIIGTIRLWTIVAGGVPALLLGPLAVAKSHSGQGIGGKLICHALQQAVLNNHKAVILVGDAPYYARFGFRRDLTDNLVLPGPVNRERFLGLELEPGALSSAMGLVIATGERAPILRRSARSTALEQKAA